MSTRTHTPLPLAVILLFLAGCAAPCAQSPTPDDHPACVNAAAAPLPARSHTLDIADAESPKSSAPPMDTHDVTPHAGHAQPPPLSDARTDGALYTCPMHPEIVSKEPGRCPKCNMKLVPKEKEGGHE